MKRILFLLALMVTPVCGMERAKRVLTGALSASATGFLISSVYVLCASHIQSFEAISPYNPSLQLKTVAYSTIGAGILGGTASFDREYSKKLTDYAELGCFLGYVMAGCFIATYHCKVLLPGFNF